MNFPKQLLFVALLNWSLFAMSPVEMHGRLSVDGTKIVGEHGQPVQLMGMSLYWSCWGPQKYWNKDVVDWLVEDWNIDMIRAAMAVDINDAWAGTPGWIHNKEEQYAMVKTVVDAAIDNGIYVAVNWHTHYIHTDAAVEFFTHMAQEYADYPNIIWQPFNEPTLQSWNDIKESQTTIINAIRQYSPNLVVAGTRGWSTELGTAANDRIPDDNTAYSFHFYAGQHGQDMRNWSDAAINNGLPVFISEWGTTAADGGKTDRTVYVEESNIWINWALDRDISMTNWSISDIDEESAALIPGAPVTGGWDPQTQLTTSGRFMRDLIRDLNTAKGYWSGNDSISVVNQRPALSSPQISVSENTNDISFTLNNPGNVRAEFYNAQGRLVYAVEWRMLDAGLHRKNLEPISAAGFLTGILKIDNKVIGTFHKLNL